MHKFNMATGGNGPKRTPSPKPDDDVTDTGTPQEPTAPAAPK